MYIYMQILIDNFIRFILNLVLKTSHQLEVKSSMLNLLFLSCLPFLAMVYGKTEKDTDALLHMILREQASMIKHCMSNVCTRNMFNPYKPGGPWYKRMQVGFSAYLTSSGSLPSSGRIVFKQTRTNIGNAYDTNTGIFTAPVDGMYAFHWTIMVASGKYSTIHIQVNGSSKQVMYANASSYPNYYSPSQSYMTDLKKGDKVNLYNSGSRGYAHGTYSTFTGYKL